VGRKPIGRRALSDAAKQQRYRDRLKRARLQADKDAIYAKAKAKRDAVHARLADASIAAAAQLEALPRFPLVVMDPGTKFDVRSERGMNRSNPSNHYITETWAKISSDPPPLHDHALLLCWATQANCHLMMRIVEDRWGLTIKSLFTWDKMIIGMGYWGRSRYEYLIVATKGRGLRVPFPSDRTPNGFIEKARRGPGGHSASRRAPPRSGASGQLRLELLQRDAAEGRTVALAQPCALSGPVRVIDGDTIVLTNSNTHIRLKCDERQRTPLGHVRPFPLVDALSGRMQCSLRPAHGRLSPGLKQAPARYLLLSAGPERRC
jgi:hypothetical protein